MMPAVNATFLRRECVGGGWGHAGVGFVGFVGAWMVAIEWVLHECKALVHTMVAAVLCGRV